MSPGCAYDRAWDDRDRRPDPGEAVDSKMVEVLLPNGSIALVRAAGAEGGGATKTSLPGRFIFDDVVATLDGISSCIKKGLEGAAPDEATVEMSIDLAIRAGKLTALLVEGQGAGSLTVTLKWNFAAAREAT